MPQSHHRRLQTNNRTPARKRSGYTPIAEYIKTTALTQAHKASQQPVSNVTKQMTHQLRRDTWKGRPTKNNPTLQTRLTSEARRLVGRAGDEANAKYRGKLQQLQDQQRQGRWLRREPPTPPNLTAKALLRKRQNTEWEARWNRHKERIPSGQKSKPPAYRTPWKSEVPVMHTSLSKAQSTVVQGIDSPTCPCGWRRQTPEHVVS